MRRTIVMLAVLAMLVGVLALPALSAGPFTYRESSSAFCDFDENLKSRIYAVGDHKHWLPGASVEIDRPWSWGNSYVTWRVTEGTVSLYNQTGGSYSYPSSYAYCG